ncbi:Hypothetical protein SCF082_LOCUS20017 [Durusdinium trenchii]|uniref:Uncharacterized protein n=1 Tax=Durusdinium trenchii TaxID=1381693 RepID=A0ABP0KZR5_9DINO
MPVLPVLLQFVLGFYVAAKDPGHEETRQGSCFNPLFQPHWAGKSDIRHLASKPTVETSLRLCPFWNSKPTCCTLAFEQEQQRAFQLWKEHWKEKEQRLEAFYSQMDDFRLSPSYQQASLFNRELFDTAKLRVGRIMQTYGLCFDTLLEYAAGMLCFPCQPHWHHQVLMSQFASGPNRVVSLKISEYSNDALWDSCKPLAEAAKELDHRIQDSLLAKMIEDAYVDFHMFYDRIRISQYMEQIGRVIMRGPNELTIRHSHHVSPQLPGLKSDRSRSRILKAAEATNKSNTSSHRNDEISGPINPILDGQRSGFEYRVFPRPDVDAFGKRCFVGTWLVSFFMLEI